jgi:hypothetical protein
MISPNLHAIWVFFLLNLSQELKLVLLLYFGTLGDGYSLKGSKKIAFTAHLPYIPLFTLQDVSVVDPDPVEEASFYQIRIRISFNHM